MASRGDYAGFDIPVRLWWSGRRLRVIPREDRVYMRHEPLSERGGYEFYIPGHDAMEDQSVNSHGVNRFGTPRDVLFDTARGEHHWDFQIACFPVRDIQSLALPNDNSIEWKIDKKTNKKIQKRGPDIFTFEVKHSPDDRMYPHCIIEAKKNGFPLKDVPKTMRTAIRSQFAVIAERHRESMLKFYSPGKRVKCRAIDHIILAACKVIERLEIWCSN